MIERAKNREHQLYNYVYRDQGTSTQLDGG